MLTAQEYDTALPRDCYALCAPDGPHTPFAWPTFFWLDSFRILIMTLGLILVFWTVAKFRDSPSSGQRARLSGHALASLIVIGTELDHLGDYPHYRLFASFFCILLLLWGTAQMKYEVPPQDKSPVRNGA